LQVGLSDLIASSEDEYVRIATDLAKDPARLSHLKTSLRDKCLATVWCVPEGGAVGMGLGDGGKETERES
jgi:predicted O-linked N-acetylglucosamine transferase (SPINDLY family)